MDAWYSNIYQKIGVHDARVVVGGWGDRYVSFLIFDFSGLPLTATSAKLQIFAYPNTGGATRTTMVLKNITTQWQSRTVSLTNTPASSAIQSLVAPPQFGWYSIDVTSLYNGWRKGNLSSLNFGVRLDPNNISNNFNEFLSSAFSTASARPRLVVTYNGSSTDNIISLKWPLGQGGSKSVNNAFGTDWTPYSTKCPGIQKIHNGVDYAAIAGTSVYAAEDGFIREVSYDSTWRSNIVIQSLSPNGTPYTHVYWHVDLVPNGDAAQFYADPKKQPLFVPKGVRIATVANLGSKTHFHFGVRIGAYMPALSGLGGLPKTGGCVDSTDGITYPEFPSGFVNVQDTTKILFQ